MHPRREALLDAGLPGSPVPGRSKFIQTEQSRVICVQHHINTITADDPPELRLSEQSTVAEE